MITKNCTEEDTMPSSFADVRKKNMFRLWKLSYLAVSYLIYYDMANMIHFVGGSGYRTRGFHSSGDIHSISLSSLLTRHKIEPCVSWILTEYSQCRVGIGQVK